MIGVSQMLFMELLICNSHSNGNLVLEDVQV